MKAVILAGGVGARLWPFSRTDFPKQFLHFQGEHSLLQKTFLRFLKLFRLDEIFVLTTSSYQDLVHKQLLEVNDGFLKEQILVEPLRRNTAPAIALAIKSLLERCIKPDECLLIAPSDQYISSEEVFLSLLQEAEQEAKKKKIVTFGVTPRAPETGYGYLKVDAQYGVSAVKVEAFIEKPSAEKAQEYFKSKQYLWNCGIFVFQIQHFLDNLKIYAPKIHDAIQESYDVVLTKYEEMPDISIDHAVMEKSTSVVVLPMDVFWTDLGNWDSIFEILPKCQNLNAKVGRVLAVDTKNSLIIGGRRLITSVGLEGMLVVDTDDAIFLGKRGESQKVGELMEALNNEGTKEHLEKEIYYRPWGYYSILESSVGYKVKKIIVNPGQKLSLQYHYHRKEHWLIVKGKARVTKDTNVLTLGPSDTIEINKQQVHRLENISKIESLEVIEIQIGSYLGEDDVVRLEDMYGRQSEACAYIETN